MRQFKDIVPLDDIEPHLPDCPRTLIFLTSRPKRKETPKADSDNFFAGVFPEYFRQAAIVLRAKDNLAPCRVLDKEGIRTRRHKRYFQFRPASVYRGIFPETSAKSNALGRGLQTFGYPRFVFFEKIDSLALGGVARLSQQNLVFAHHADAQIFSAKRIFKPHAHGDIFAAAVYIGTKNSSPDGAIYLPSLSAVLRISSR